MHNNKYIIREQKMMMMMISGGGVVVLDRGLSDGSPENTNGMNCNTIFKLNYPRYLFHCTNTQCSSVEATLGSQKLLANFHFVNRECTARSWPAHESNHQPS